MSNSLPSRNSPGQSTGVNSYSFLQGIFPTQGLNPGLPHCRQILYQLSHQGSPRILEWVAFAFSSRSSPTQESNLGLLHCRRILYQLSYQGWEGGTKGRGYMYIYDWHFPDSSAGKESTCNAGDAGLIPGSGSSPGEGIGYPLQHSWLPWWLRW